MVRFNRFWRLSTLCLLTSCAIGAETDETIKTPSIEVPTTKLYSVPSGTTNAAPCHTTVHFVTPTGLIVTVELDCFLEKPRGPISDTPEDKSSNEIITPGWKRPQPPGDPLPQINPQALK